MRREQFTVGQLIRSGASNGAVTVLETDELNRVTVAKCATGSIPNAVAGYAVGCLLINTTTGHLYVNTGTAASCTFNDVGAVAAGEISLASGKILIGGATGVAAEKTPSGAISMTTEGIFSLTTAASPFANEIADPGTGQAIPVTASGVVPITTGAAGETNTLAAPSAIGMFLALTCNVFGGGNRVVTCATTVDQTGNNTLTFGAAGDTILLYSTKIGGNLRWRVASNDGVALSIV